MQYHRLLNSYSSPIPEHFHGEQRDYSASTRILWSQNALYKASCLLITFSWFGKPASVTGLLWAQSKWTSDQLHSDTGLSKTWRPHELGISQGEEKGKAFTRYPVPVRLLYPKPGKEVSLEASIENIFWYSPWKTLDLRWERSDKLL